MTDSSCCSFASIFFLGWDGIGWCENEKFSHVFEYQLVFTMLQSRRDISQIFGLPVVRAGPYRDVYVAVPIHIYTYY